VPPAFGRSKGERLVNVRARVARRAEGRPGRRAEATVHRPRISHRTGSGAQNIAKMASTSGVADSRDERAGWGSRGPVATLVNELIDVLRPTEQSDRRRRGVFRHIASLVDGCFAGENVLVRARSIRSAIQLFHRLAPASRTCIHTSRHPTLTTSLPHSSPCSGHRVRVRSPAHVPTRRRHRRVPPRTPRAPLRQGRLDHQAESSRGTRGGCGGGSGR